MNRRSFLKGIGAVIGGIALEQAIPFNRVWSFPKEIKVVQNFDQNFYVNHELTLPSAWFTEQIKPRYIIVHPDQLQIVKEILGIS